MGNWNGEGKESKEKEQKEKNGNIFCKQGGEEGLKCEEYNGEKKNHYVGPGIQSVVLPPALQVQGLELDPQYPPQKKKRYIRFKFPMMSVINMYDKYVLIQKVKKHMGYFELAFLYLMIM